MIQNNLKIDFLHSDIHKTVKAKQFINSSFLKIIKIIFYVTGAILAVYLIGSYWGIWGVSAKFMGISILIISLAMLLAMMDIYINFHHHEISKPSLQEALENTEPTNLAEYFDETLAIVLAETANLKNKYHLSELPPFMAFLSLGKFGASIELLLRSQIVISQDQEKEVIAGLQNSQTQAKNPDAFWQINEILKQCILNAIKEKRTSVDVEDIFVALADSDPTTKKILDDQGIKLPDVREIANWHRRVRGYSQKQYFWQKKYYGRGIGQDWASGYTPVLNYYAKDISEYLVDAKLQVLAEAHKPVIERIEDVLAKSGANNVMLVGEAGVGKKTVVNGFAQKVVRGQALPGIRYKHVVELDTNSIMAGANEAELQMRFSRVFNEAIRAGNIILYINDFDNLVNPRSEQLGTVDASQFLLPYLKSDQLQVLATTSFNNWHKKIEANSALANLFSKIDIVEPPAKEMLPILEDSAMNLEVTHKIIFTYRALNNIINLTDRHIHDEVFPQKAINLAQALAVRFGDKNKYYLLTSSDVENLFSQQYKVPTSQTSKAEKEKLLNLEIELHQRVIDQEEGITLISNAMRRARAGLAKKNKPIGSFLFVGPTGVGKTETTKALAAIYFGSERQMIRFDMSEFQQISSIERLIGSENPQAKEEQGLLSVAIRENPYTVLLFDELEKAHPSILNLFLQMLDEGTITDTSGRKLDFTNAIIIATSNAGAEEIRQYIKSGKPLDKLSSYILDFLQKEKIFRPEFLNRFDAVVCFKPLLPEHILAIAKLMIGKLQKNLLADKDIKLEITPEAIAKLAKLGYDPTLGARPMQRVIQEKVENLIAQKLLREEAKKGQTIVIIDKEII